MSKQAKRTTTAKQGYTKGPWKVSNLLSDRIQIGTLSDEIASINPNYNNNSNSDARLIAAAPELLASLQAMVWVAEYYVKPGTDGFELLKDAKRIIAKAEGNEGLDEISSDERRIRELEDEGLTRSDAQAVFEAEQLKRSRK